jgi:hypothetical protein
LTPFTVCSTSASAVLSFFDSALLPPFLLGVLSGFWPPPSLLFVPAFGLELAFFALAAGLFEPSAVPADGFVLLPFFPPPPLPLAMTGR